MRNCLFFIFKDTNKKENKMTPHKHKDIIIAWANGAEIEFLSPNGIWSKPSTYSFNPNCEYRIKPEPKIIPFDFSDAEKIIGKVIKHKGSPKCIEMITIIDNDIIWTSPNRSYDFKYLLEQYTFSDGSPFGKVSE